MTGQVWYKNENGGYLYAPNLSPRLRMQVQATSRFRQLCDIPDWKGKQETGKGDTVTWDVFQELPDDVNADLTETTAITMSGFKVFQGKATVAEWGVAIPFTSWLKMNAAHNVERVIDKVLSTHAKKVYDRKAHAEFDKSHLRYVATGAAAGELTVNGVAASNNNAPLNKYHVKRIANIMKERNIPGFAGTDDYFCVARPSTFEALTTELESVQQYTTEGYGKIMRGELGRYDGVRFIEQTNIGQGAGKGAWSNGASDSAYFLGDDGVAEIITVPPEIRGQIPGDFGRSHAVAWYGAGAFSLVYNDDADPISEGSVNSRIVVWDSAA